MENLTSRQLKAGELVKRSLAEIFYTGKIFDKDLADISINVSEVRMSPDLKVAKVFVSSLGGVVDANILLESLKKITHNLRMLVTKKIQLKYSPELIFIYDKSFDNVQNIDNLLRHFSDLSV